MRLAGINLHPVKSTAIRPAREAYVGAAGLVGDREWMVVDARGAMVSARELPALFSLVADPGVNGIELSAAGSAGLAVPVPTDGEEVAVSIHGKSPFPARRAGEAADRWLEETLGVPGLRLVWCADPARREVSTRLGMPGDRVAFQDGSAVSLASTASMAALNEWSRAADGPTLPVSRFRANLVVDGVEEAFAEDGWKSVRVGGAVLRVAGPIDRCVMTTIDPASLAKGKDPIRTLARHRRWDGKTWFAVHLMVEEQGPIALGDELVVD